MAAAAPPGPPVQRPTANDYNTFGEFNITQRADTDSSKWGRPKRKAARSPLWNYYARATADAAVAICLFCWNWTQKAIEKCAISLSLEYVYIFVSLHKGGRCR
jgi:hypothetical protein